MNSTKTSKKLVFITSRFPFPIEKGDKLRAFYQLRDLSESWEIHLIALSDVEVTQTHREAIEPFCKNIHILKISKWMGYLRVLLGLFGQRPFQVYYFKKWSYQRKVKKLLHEIQPDHIFAQLIRTTEYVKDYHACPKTLDYMDILSAGVQKRIALAPKILQPIFDAEWRRLLKYEHIVFDYFEKHTIISEQDREQLMHSEKQRVVVLPNGVDDHFLNFETTQIEKDFDLCFVGNLSYAPNVEAVKFIANELVPALKKEGLDLRILVSGANPTTEVLAFKNQLTITGWVDDIRMSYARSKVFIAPMFIGTGLQNKILEALALGLPCITTPLAHKAFNGQSDVISVASDAQEFAREIRKQLESYKYASKIEDRQNFVKTYYDWREINAKLNELMVD